MLDDMDARVAPAADEVVGDFCSILIIAGAPENEAAAKRLLDVVTSDTWHGSRLIWRSVAVVCEVVSAVEQFALLLAILACCWNCAMAWFHVSGTVRLQPAAAPFASIFVDTLVPAVVLLWCCWCKFRMQSLIFLLCFADFEDFFEEFFGVVDEFDDVELPELTFSALIAVAVG